ncbi:MAG: hypothetical protein D6689_00795 [Deltaproteobacteria bacterium]|nr:MAG: hypothetical protein D6689_00795 [Deltaproteobacteria bacterium]
MSLWSRIERRLGELAGELLPSEHRERLDRARDALAAGDPAGAEALLAEALAERPDDAAAHALRGAALLACGRPAEAAAAFAEAVALDPDDADAHVGAGEAALALGDAAAAVAAFRRALAVAGGDAARRAAAYRGLGAAHRAAGDVDRAIRELRKAVAEAPADPESLAALGAALVDGGAAAAGEARRHLARACARSDAPAAAWAALGRAELALGHVDEADAAFARAGDDVDAVAGRGDVALARGDADEARALYRAAIARAPGRADLHVRLGDAARAAGRPDEAFEHYARAVDLGAGDAAARSAVDAAIAADRADARAVDLANRVLAGDAESAAALVVRARALVAAGEAEPARAVLAAVVDRGDHPEAHVELARLALAAGDAAGAARHAWAALRADGRNPRARAALVAARTAQAGALGGDVVSRARALERVARADPALADLAPDVGRAVEDFDRPLLVTVMGEFSTGKSTFINAFVEESIAPVGITPTTATINVLKFGRERGGRIVYRDGRTVPLPWTPLRATLEQITADDARQIAAVEILYPLPVLERVHIVDTPGLNSILPEHEQVARDFIGRADAVVWLFAAGQAGKESERAALASIHATGTRVLGVVNKVDQLAADDVREVVAYLRGELGDLVDDLVPLSAKAALASHAAGNWPALADALERRFFARARELKREACERRLSALIARARDRSVARREAATAAAAELAAAAASLRAGAARFRERDAPSARGQLAEAVARLYRDAAREVLELVRPRALPFGAHRATRADRDYLVGLLARGYRDAIEPVRAAVGAQLRAGARAGATAAARAAAVVGNAAAERIEQLGDEVIELVDARVFERASAFVDGFLRGGAVDRFFRDALPKLQLTEDNVYHALYRDAPDLDAELGEPLARAGADALAALADRLDALAAVADAAAYDADAGTLAAIEAIARATEEA